MSYNPNPARKSWNETLTEIGETLDKWRAKDFRWSCSMADNHTGRGASHWSWSQWPASQVGVTVEFTHPKTGPRTITVSRFDCPANNLRAIWHGLEAIRLNELRGLDDVAREFYAALPAPAVKRDPWVVLGLQPGADRESVEAVYRSKAKRLHPDAGGDADGFKELQEAYELVKAGRS